MNALVWSRPQRCIWIVVAIMVMTAGAAAATDEKVLSFNLTRDIFLADSFHATEILGWAPVLYSAHSPDSRGLLFLEDRVQAGDVR